jgi:hypothetical protein
MSMHKVLTGTQLAKAELTEAQLIARREEEIQEGLVRFAGRKRYEPCTEETPLSALLGPDAEAENDLQEWAIRNEAIRRLAQYVCQDGPHPCEVLKKLYAVFGHMGIAPFCELTLREKALIFGDSHESHRWLMRKLCVKPLQRNGARSIRAPGAKGRDAQEASARVQKGNNNRNGGKKAGTRNAERGTRNGKAHPQANDTGVVGRKGKKISGQKHANQ